MTDLSPLVGTEVRQIRLDYQVTLLLVDGPAGAERASGLLQIESQFRLESDAGAWIIAPDDKGGHAAVCQLLHLTVVPLRWMASRPCDSFSDGSTVTVGRDGRYESWNLTGTRVPEVRVTPRSRP